MATAITDDAYIKGEEIRASALRSAKRWRQLSGGIIALANGFQLIKNYKKQKGLADRSQKIADELHSWYFNVFVPRELEQLQEYGLDGGITLEPLELMSERYAGRMRADVAGKYAEAEMTLIRDAPRYSYSGTKNTLSDFYTARAASMASALVSGYNTAFAERQARDDLANNRRLQTIGLGRDLARPAASLTKAAGGALAKSNNNYSDGLSMGIAQMVNANAIGEARYDHVDLVARAGGGYEDWADIARIAERVEQNRAVNTSAANEKASRIVHNAGQVINTASDHYNTAQSQSTYLQGDAVEFGTAWSKQNLGTSSTNDYSLSFNGRQVQSNTNTGFSDTIPDYRSKTMDETMNTAGNVGHADTVRYGEARFPIRYGYVTVKMSKFPIGSADAKQVTCMPEGSVTCKSK